MSQPDVAHLVPGGKAFPPKVLRDLTGFRGVFVSCELASSFVP